MFFSIKAKDETMPGCEPPCPGSITISRCVVLICLSARDGAGMKARINTRVKRVKLAGLGNFLDTFIYKRYFSKLCVKSVNMYYEI